jgi:hypothetical protein
LPARQFIYFNHCDKYNMNPVGMIMLGFQSLIIAIVVYFSSVLFPNYPILVSVLSTLSFILIHTHTPLGEKVRTIATNICPTARPYKKIRRARTVVSTPIVSSQSTTPTTAPTTPTTAPINQPTPAIKTPYIQTKSA